MPNSIHPAGGNLTEYRASEAEQLRIADLFAMVPPKGARALDVGAREGYLSRRLAERFDHVIALDLQRPEIDAPRVEPVSGDATRLQFADNTFDLVLCSEVLEHIPSPALEAACREIVRVAADNIVIGVPYCQDLRVGETTCRNCGRPNPPWGHVNSFDEARLRSLFASAHWVRHSLVWRSPGRTNATSTALNRFAGNPFGTYEQEEHCVHCDSPIGQPATRSSLQRVATRAATLIDRIQAAVTAPRAMWIHVQFSKKPAH